ncbi:hypothetical protein RRG08_041075 [Elysia crispata]|uniref:Uncharacterized protein n=1 Tax=Elysia crispata TaxID=231223 RepID=A0AAE0Y9B5_9GAST|nr:hypothetical protein RRG08_041075 [Elysia crispata]
MFTSSYCDRFATTLFLSSVMQGSLGGMHAHHPAAANSEKRHHICNQGLKFERIGLTQFYRRNKEERYKNISRAQGETELK